jgi:hypothetical protein
MKTKKNKNSYIFFIAIFFISLQSFYFNSIGMPVYSVFGLLLLIILSLFYPRPIYKNHKLNTVIDFTFLKMTPLIFISLSLLASIFYGKIDLFRFLSFILIALIPFFYERISSYIDPLKIICMLIFVHSFVFFTQFILFYVFSIDLDPVSIFSEAEQTGWGGLQEHGALGKFRRLGGLYKEPGTFATFVAPLVGVLFLKSKSKIYDFISYLGITAVFLTFSMYAWIFCIFLFAMKFYQKKYIIFWAPIFLYVLVQIALPYIQYRFFDSSSAIGIDFRIEMISNIIDFNISGFTYLFFGTGLFTLESPFPLEAAINDVGLIFYIMLTGGIFGLLLIVIFVFSAVWRLKIPGIFLGFMILSSKISLTAPMFWVIILLIRHASHPIDTTKNIRV